MIFHRQLSRCSHQTIIVGITIAYKLCGPVGNFAFHALPQKQPFCHKGVDQKILHSRTFSPQSWRSLKAFRKMRP